MEKFSQFTAPPTASAGLRRIRSCGATILTVTLACGFGLAQAQSVSVGGISAGASVGRGGISAGASVGGSSGVNAGASVGGTSGVSAGASVGGASGVNAGATVGGTSGVNAGVSVGGTSGVNAGVSVGGVAGTGTPGVGTTTGTTTGTTNSPVQIGVGVGPLVGKTHKHKKVAAAKPLAILGPNSVVGVDTNVLGLDVVADALKYNGNILDLCVGSCHDTAVAGGGTGGGGSTGGGGTGGGGTGGGGTGGSGNGGSGGDGSGGGVVVADPGAPVIIPLSASDAPVVLAGNNIGVGTMGPCGEGSAGAASNASQVAMTGAQSNGNPGPGFAMSTSDLNLPIKGVQLRCSAGGNAQVYNGYTVLDMNGKKIGIVHDAFLTADLKLRRVQFQGLDQRCFGLSDGKYTVKGDNVTVNVPASFVYQ